MNPMQDLPMGFGTALMKNQAALARFSSMSAEQRQQILDQTHAVSSKVEMQAFVNSLMS